MRVPWTDSYLRGIEKAVKRYDIDLYVERNKQGIPLVLRKRKRFQKAYLGDDFKILKLIDSPEFVMALTDNWRTTGVFREYGPEPILMKLREMDFAMDPDLIEKMDQKNEKIDETRRKDFRNNLEAMISDDKRIFQKAFSDVRTANMDMSERHRRKRELRRRF